MGEDYFRMEGDWILIFLPILIVFMTIFCGVIFLYGDGEIMSEGHEFCQRQGYDFISEGYEYSEKIGKVKCYTSYGNEFIDEEFDVERRWFRIREVVE